MDFADVSAAIFKSPCTGIERQNTDNIFIALLQQTLCYIQLFVIVKFDLVGSFQQKNDGTTSLSAN